MAPASSTTAANMGIGQAFCVCFCLEKPFSPAIFFKLWLKLSSVPKLAYHTECGVTLKKNMYTMELSMWILACDLYRGCTIMFKN